MTPAAWPKLSLGDIAPIVRRPVAISHDQIYPELGIRSFGRGTFHKPAVSGADIGTKRLFRIEPNDLIFSNIFAWEGAIAVASPDDAGRFGSHRFITCVVDPSRADATYLKLYLTTAPEGRDQIMQASPGGAGRNRTLGVEKLGQVQVPLPPLADQQAVVFRLDALAEKTRQVEAHLNAIEKDCSDLLLSLHHKFALGRRVKLRDVIELHELSDPVRATRSYPQVGLRGFGGGLFAKSAISGTETTYKAFNRLFTGAIVLSQVKGWEGAIAMCPSNLHGWYVSPEYRTFKCREDQSVPEYLGALVKTEWFWSHLLDATRGVGARRERTRPEQFLNIEIPMPTMVDQKRIVEIWGKQTQLAERNAAIRQANTALLPATLERVFTSA